MIDVITFENAHEFGDVLPAMLRLRHRIFVGRHGYTVPTHRGMEWDQFDTPAAQYLCWRDGQGQPRGIIRLLPTDRPYMIQKLWPDLIESGQLPSDRVTWEWTRFGVDHDLDHATKTRIVGELLCGCMEFALQHQITSYVFVTPKQVVKGAYRRHGVQVELLGQEKDLGGFAIVAGRIPVSAALLTKLRQRNRIQSRVLRLPQSPAQTRSAETLAASAA